MKTQAILYISSASGPGGAEMLVGRIASQLDPNQFRSVVALFSPGWLKDRCEALGLSTYVLPMRSQWDIGWIFRCCALVRKERIALIHAHEFRANTFGAVVARLCGIPLVATVHGKNYYVDHVKRRLAYRWVSFSAYMIAVSHDLCQFLNEQVGVPNHRVAVIHNGVDPIEPVSLEMRSRARAMFGINESEFVIGVVGSLYEVKGHRYLLQAIEKVLHCHAGVKLLVIGQGNLEEALKRQAADLGIDGRVLFLGLRNDVPRLLPMFDMFVLPSLSEGLSIALLEAMAAGIAVVATCVGGNPEIVVDGETGWLVPPKDEGLLADRILDLMRNPDRLKAFGERGRDRVAVHFSTARMLAQYQWLYRQCLAGGGTLKNQLS